MFTPQKLTNTAVATALILLGTVAKAAAASLYAVTELPFIPADINEHNQIVGGNYLWDNGNITNLRNLPGAKTNFMGASAINNKGDIVGSYLLPDQNERAFISDGKIIKQLEPVSSDTCGGGDTCAALLATDINDAGEITLIGLLPTGYGLRYGAYALLRDTKGNNTLLNSSRYILNLSINNVGQVAGNAAGGGLNNPFFWHQGTRTRLFSPASSFTYEPARLTDINDLGQVVGSGGIPTEETPGFTIHAMLWDDPLNNSRGVDLGNLGNSNQTSGANSINNAGRIVISEANGINNAGQIVGYSYTSTNNAQHAVLWEDKNIFDINNLIVDNLGWELSNALMINNKGQIIGTGYFNGQQRGFLLTPIAKSVPEPTSTLSLLGLAAFGISSLRKRQQQQKKGT